MTSMNSGMSVGMSTGMRMVSGHGGRLTRSQAEGLAAELDRLCRPDRQGLSPELVASLRVRIVARWQESAACAGADPEAWFPDRQGAQVPSSVVRTCAGCPVRQSCLASALLWSVDGIWAGTTASDRQRTSGLLRAGALVADVLTRTLDHAEARADQKAQARRRRRDWFHTDPHTLTDDCPGHHCGTDLPGAAA